MDTLWNLLPYHQNNCKFNKISKLYDFAYKLSGDAKHCQVFVFDWNWLFAIRYTTILMLDTKQHLKASELDKSALAELESLGKFTVTCESDCGYVKPNTPPQNKVIICF